MAGAAALFGTLSYVTRSAAEIGIDAAPFIFWRGLIATLALAPISALFFRRTGRANAGLRDLSAERRRALIYVSLIGAVLNIAMFEAFLRTTIAVVLICFYTFPAIVTIAAVPLYGERIDRVRAAALVLSGIGLVLVVLAPVMSSTGVTIDLLGVGLAFAAAVCQATFILMVGRGFDPMPAPKVAIFALAAAGAMALVLSLVTGQVDDLTVPFRSAEAWVWILAGGIAGAAIPTTAFIAGIGLIGPSRAAIMMTVEPLVGVGLAALLLGERPSILQLFGGAAVLVAAAILQIAPRRAPIEPEPEFSRLV